MAEKVRKLNVKAVILVGARDFGRCPLASRLPTALWPVLGKPVLERLLSHLADQGIRQAVICCNGERQLLAESIRADDRLELEFYDELLPVGTAGCIRDSADSKSDELLVVFPATTTVPPAVDWLISEHQRGQADLTVFLNPCLDKEVHGRQASGIYLCNSDILQHIPEVGYFDIKEGLIPLLLIVGKTVRASELRRYAGTFKDRQEYLLALERCIESASDLCSDIKPFQDGERQDVWVSRKAVSRKAKIESDARICGPVVIMDDVTVSRGAVVLGPAVLECNAAVSADSVVADSVLWAGAKIAPNCRIEGAVVDSHVNIAKGTSVQNKAIAHLSKNGSNSTGSIRGVQPLLGLISLMGVSVRNAGNLVLDVKRGLLSSFEMPGHNLPDWARFDKKTVLTFLGSIVILAAFVWSYRDAISDLWSLWIASDEYSSGLLVPFMAVYILWARRSDISRCSIKPSVWGLIAFVFVQMFRFIGLFLMYSWPEKLSVVLSVAALTLLLFGWQCLRKVWPILLLVFDVALA